MKKTILLFGVMLIGMTAFGQNTKETPKSEVSKEKSDASKEQQIAALEDLVRRSGENNPEGIKAKAMIAALRMEQLTKETPAEEQKRMNETLSPAEYTAWKNKQAAKQNTNQPINTPQDK